MTAISPTCDHHDLPLVCGACRKRRGDWEHVWSERWVTMKYHRFKPVHLLVDPEGIEGTQHIPCPL